MTFTGYKSDRVIALAHALMAQKEMELKALRRTGRTTRLVDKYIQQLFDKPGEWVVVVDHVEEGNEVDNRHIWHLINKRLAVEHRSLYESDNFQTNQSNSMRIVMHPNKLQELRERMGK